MAAATVEKAPVSNEAKLENKFVDTRVEEYKKRRWAGLWSSSVLKNTGFIATVAGAAAILASPVLAPGLTAAAVAYELGKTAVIVGLPVMIFGAIKELYNERKRP